MLKIAILRYFNKKIFLYIAILRYLCNTINQSYKYINLNSKSNGNKREFLEK